MLGFTKNKAPGFYLTCLIVVLAVVTDLVYTTSYATFMLLSTTAISWPAVWLLAAGSVAAVLLLFLHQEAYIHYVVVLFYGIAFFFFIYGIYYYVSIMAYGIDASFNFTFFLNAGLFVALLVLSIVDVFVPQIKDPQ